MLRLSSAALFAGLAFAEAPAFDVASVKPSQPDGPKAIGIVRILPGNQTYVTRNMPLRVIITVAYSVTDRQISGGPDWLNTELWDIDAKSERRHPDDEMHSMLARLLEERFQLGIRHERREMPVWALVVDKSGPRLTEHDGADLDHPPFGPGPNGRGFSGRNVGMPYFAFLLSRMLDRNVIDRTGLTKNYDLTLDFARDIPGADAPSIFTALREQLGLRLEASRGAVEFLVIERAERPRDN